MPKVIDLEGLYEAAVTVFAERGFEAATTQEIARRAGVNEVTLFRRFGNKAALIEAALAYCLSQSPFGMLTGTDDVRADLTAIVVAYQTTYRSYGGAVFTLLSEVGRHPELRSVMSVLMPNLRSAAGIIEVHQRRKHLTRGDPLQMVVLLIAPIMAQGLWARTGAAQIVPAFEAEAIVAGFLDGHRPRRS